MDWERGFDDPAYFAEAVLKVKLHAGQKTWLENATAHENILVTGNRWGKSFVCAVNIIHKAIYKFWPFKHDRYRGYRIVTASITQDQAGIIFDTALRLVRESVYHDLLLKKVTMSPYPKMRFVNGATMEARTTQNRGQYLLGQDYDLFIFDEVAFETDPEYVVEEVIQMRLADRAGRLILESTPNGQNWFCRRAREIHEKKRPGYLQYGDSRENPFISKVYLEERLKYFSEKRVKQNIMGEFVDSGGEILKGEYIDRALRQNTEIMAPGTNRQWICGWDLARKRTATVGITIEVLDGLVRVVELARFKLFDWTVIIEKIKQRQLRFPGNLVVDATGLGDVVVEQIKEFNPTSVIFTPKSKAELLTNVELFHAQKKISYERFEFPDGAGRIWSFEDELRSARWDDNSECDALMALALALWPLRTRSEIAIGPKVGKV